MSEAYTLVTGASAGFGRSIAIRLSASRKLILVGRSAETLEAVRAACVNPSQQLTWVRDLSQLEGLGDELAALLGAKNIVVEHFVHSAGLTGIQFARAHETGFATRLFNVNVFSATEIIRPLTQKKVNQGALRTITFISSVASRVGAPGYYSYAASKGAVNGLSLSLAVELAPAIRVNAILPGIIETGMSQAHFSDPNFVESVRATHPLGFGRPEDVAEAVEFLSSDHARWITGQEIVVDGGRTVFSPPRTGKAQGANAQSTEPRPPTGP